MESRSWTTVARGPLPSSPSELPLLAEYGLEVLAARTVSPKTMRDQFAAWRNRVSPHLAGLRLHDVAPRI